MQKSVAMIDQIETSPLAISLRLDKAGGLLSSYVIASVSVLVIAFFFLLAVPKIVHWFIIPAMACGVLVGADLVRLWRGDLDTFDPKGLMAIIVFYGWFIAPLLHVLWQTYGFDYTGDPRNWLGVVASANAVGLIFFKISQRSAFNRTAAVRTNWQLIPSRIFPLLMCAAVIGIAAQVVFYWKFMAAARLGNPALMQGTGWLLMLGDGMPALFIAGLITWSRSPRGGRSWIIIVMVLLVLAMVQFIWSGLRGSRSAFVGLMFFAVCLVHFYWRRLRPAHLLLGIVCLLPFMYFYGFYKGGGGAQTLEAIESSAARDRLEQQTKRTFRGMLLGDLGRADVQARIANEIVEGNNKYQLRYGKTYLMALSTMIPKTIWKYTIGESFKDRWNKAFAFFELENGKVTAPGYFPRASRVYGLSGEAMLNFGLLGVPFVWLLYGGAMGWFRRKMYTMPKNDTRWVLMPLLIGSLMSMPIGDVDNTVFALFKGGLVLFLCTLMWSHKVKIDHK
jgi:hypothetical protein